MPEVTLKQLLRGLVCVSVATGEAVEDDVALLHLKMGGGIKVVGKYDAITLTPEAPNGKVAFEVEGETVKMQAENALRLVLSTINPPTA